MLYEITSMFLLCTFSIWLGFTIGRAVGYNEARIKNTEDDFLKKSKAEMDFEKELEEKQKNLNSVK